MRLRAGVLDSAQYSCTAWRVFRKEDASGVYMLLFFFLTNRKHNDFCNAILSGLADLGWLLVRWLIMGKKLPLSNCDVSIIRYPTGLPGTMVGVRLRSNFRMTLEEYPMNFGVKEASAIEGNSIRIACVGVELTKESFDFFVNTWIERLINLSRESTLSSHRSKDFYSIDLKLDNYIYYGLMPASNKEDRDGCFAFTFDRRIKL